MSLPLFRHSSPFAWWKLLSIVLLSYAVVMGFLGTVPRLAILNETIRNLYFHVPMWFSMTLFLLVASIYSAMFLAKPTLQKNNIAFYFTVTGMVYGCLGLLTGMVWARFTWGTWWTTDPKLNAAAIGMLMYLAYLILRNAIEDQDKSARISAVYNIFAFPIFVSLIYIMPRLTDSLHPGNGGNPGFNTYDRDREMNIIFYSAVIGFMLLGVWITTLQIRYQNWRDKKDGLINHTSTNENILDTV
ncbi:MAG: cytochrome c biogenesis protein CcsA [Cytophagaceae bacterium]